MKNYLSSEICELKETLIAKFDPCTEAYLILENVSLNLKVDISHASATTSTSYQNTRCSSPHLRPPLNQVSVVA